MDTLTREQLMIAAKAIIDLSERLDVQDLFYEITEELFNRITREEL